MIEETNVTNTVTQDKASTRTVLSTLWIFLLLNIFARDIHELGRPGMLEQMMTGVVDGVKIMERLMLITISVNLNPDLDNIFFLVIKMAALFGIVWFAWRWKS